MNNVFKRFKKWWKKTLQRERDFYYNTHGIYKNRNERKAIEKQRAMRTNHK